MNTYKSQGYSDIFVVDEVFGLSANSYGGFFPVLNPVPEEAIAESLKVRLEDLGNAVAGGCRAFLSRY